MALEEYSHNNLTDALRACELFDMRDAGGVNKDFRLGKSDR